MIIPNFSGDVCQIASLYCKINFCYNFWIQQKIASKVTILGVVKFFSPFLCFLLFLELFATFMKNILQNVSSDLHDKFNFSRRHIRKLCLIKYSLILIERFQFSFCFVSVFVCWASCASFSFLGCWQQNKLYCRWASEISSEENGSLQIKRKTLS